MIIIILISLLFLLLLWILLVPLLIHVDTEGQEYYLNLPGVIRAAVVPNEELFHIRGRIFFVPFRFNPFKAGSGRKRRKKSEANKRKTRPKKQGKGILTQLTQGRRMGRKLLGSFRVRQLRLNIDTDDFMLNAYLVPVFTALNREQVHLQVNFEGHASLLMDIRTRLGGLLWAFIKTKFQHTFNS